MVNFLDIAPRAQTETMRLETAAGMVELELAGLPLSTLAAIAKQYPVFARVIEGGTGSIIEASEAMPAVIAAGLGHPGSAEYEAKVREFAAADIMTMAITVMRLTFPTTEAADPLPAGDDAAAGMAISQPASSS
jgi:hypothetical protein